MRSYRIPLAVIGLFIAGLLYASYLTGAKIDEHQNTTSGITTAETGSMGSGTGEAGQGQIKGDDQKPPAPEAR